MPKGVGYPRGKGKKKKKKVSFHNKGKKKDMMSNLFKKGTRGR